MPDVRGGARLMAERISDVNPLTPLLGAVLKERRDLLGLTRLQVIERMTETIHPQTLRTYEVGIREPTVIRLIDICSALEMSLGEAVEEAKRRVRSPSKTQRREIETRLRDNHGLTDRQITDLQHTADQVDERYPDDADKKEQALTAAYRLMVEDREALVSELGAERTQARLTEQRTHVQLQQIALTLVLTDIRATGIQNLFVFAEAAGVDVQTVRDWIGVDSPKGRGWRTRASR